MPILNYTTQVEPEKTVGEIYSILSKAGASEIAFEHANGQVAAIKFTMLHADHPLTFRMQPRPDGVLRSMQRDGVPHSRRTAKQAHRVSWRILKNAVEAQIAMYQSLQGDIAEVFLPYAIDGNGDSFYHIFTEQRIKALTAGQPPAEEDEIETAATA